MSMKVNKVLPSPAELKEEYSLSEKLIQLKKERDAEIRDIFTGKSDKFAVIIGPCSADNEDSVCEYVCRLAKVNEKVKDRLVLIPRIYTNKPRRPVKDIRECFISRIRIKLRICMLELWQSVRCIFVQ